MNKVALKELGPWLNQLLIWKEINSAWPFNIFCLFCIRYFMILHITNKKFYNIFLDFFQCIVHFMFYSHFYKCIFGLILQDFYRVFYFFYPSIRCKSLLIGFSISTLNYITYVFGWFTEEHPYHVKVVELEYHI